MPIYEYQCQQCGTLTEKIQKLSDKPLTTCEACGGKLDKLVSRTAFLLKGGGWYKDGYGAPKGAKADTDAPKPDADKGTSSGSKPDPATSPKSPPGSGGASPPAKGKGSGKS